MIYEDIQEFSDNLPIGKAIIGLDLGTKTIGVSVSDGLLSVATPLETVKRTKYTADALSTVAAERALLEADTSRKRRGEVIDHVAAAYILQGALDRIGFMRRAV
jgi:putative Holliday junction resolvase